MNNLENPISGPFYDEKARLWADATAKARRQLVSGFITLISDDVNMPRITFRLQSYNSEQTPALINLPTRRKQGNT